MQKGAARRCSLPSATTLGGCALQQRRELLQFGASPNRDDDIGVVSVSHCSNKVALDVKQIKQSIQLLSNHLLAILFTFICRLPHGSTNFRIHLTSLTGRQFAFLANKIDVIGIARWANRNKAVGDFLDPRLTII
jgi:hypothetical protein